jgi:hypothetical protein
MLKSIGIAIVIVMLVWQAKNWLLSGAPYSNDKGQIVDEKGLVVIPNLIYLMPSDSDAAICSALVDPSKLSWEHYSTPSGFDACVARCLTDTTSQVCSQFPHGSNILATQPHVMKQMLNSCQENIKSFVKRGVHCGYLNCEP